MRARPESLSTRPSALPRSAGSVARWVTARWVTARWVTARWVTARWIIVLRVVAVCTLALAAVALGSSAVPLAIAGAADGPAPVAASPLVPLPDDWVRPFKTATYGRHSRFDSLPPDVGRYRVTRALHRVEPTRSLFEDCERRLDGRRPVDCVLTFRGRDGFGNAASPLKGVWDWWSPPQVILPDRVVAGERWTELHLKRGSTSRRSCEILPDVSFCDDGIESRCVTEFDGGDTVVLAQHFCRGLGWVGEDARARPDGNHTFSTFTYDVVVDGVRMPERRDAPVEPVSPETVSGSGRGA
ncbi:MAG: hypothetical protein EXR69_01545 [Myxococcales bacterium]|nr:hypothetical protein [Myxococcales bacterium]